MHKLVLVLRRTADPEALERQWSERFVPLAERMPGLRRVVVGRTAGAPGSIPNILLIHELLFDDLESLRRAMTSPEGQQAGRALMSFAADRSELFFAEHLEMEVPDRGPEHPAGIPS